MRIFALPQVRIDGKLGSSCKQWEALADMSDHIEVHSKAQSPAEWAAATGPGVESVFQYGLSVDREGGRC
jgi:hypothetical protein